MATKVTRILILSAALSLYAALEVALFKGLGWQGVLLATPYFTAFAGASLAGLMYRPHGVAPIAADTEKQDCPKFRRAKWPVMQPLAQRVFPDC